MIDWPIGKEHAHYGCVKMVGVIGGERYRWFVDGSGSVSMIPLDTLLSEEKVNE